VDNNAIVAIAIANIAGLVTFFVSLKVSQAEMKVRLERLEKDLDRLGTVLGTQRSRGLDEKT
jgi:hypothetical protein